MGTGDPAPRHRPHRTRDGPGNPLKLLRSTFFAGVDGAAGGQVADLDGGGLRRSAGGWHLLRKVVRGREKWACDERLLGSGDFAHKVLSRIQPDLLPTPPADPSALLAALANRLAAMQAVRAPEVARSSLRRSVVDAHALLSCAAVQHYGLTLTAVARHLGMSVTIIARGLARGQQIIASGARSLENLRLD